MSQDGSESGSAYAPSDDGAESKKTGRRDRKRTTSISRDVHKNGGGSKSVDTIAAPVLDSRPAKKYHPTLSKKKEGRATLDSYRTLYNATVEEAATSYITPSDGPLPPSQIGVTTWTSLEKEIFFQRLSILGKDDICGIAASLDGKSESEVRQYILLLDEGVLEANALGHAAVPMSEIPAASEVSRDCEDALEAAAEALAGTQVKADQRREMKRHGEYWLLTEDVAAECEEAIRGIEEQHQSDGPASDDDGDEKMHLDPSESPSSPSPSMPVPAAELLHLQNFLHLSKLFMHTSTEWWPAYAPPTTPPTHPSIYATAFTDFHTLTVSLTTRILRATIFQTLSRLRSAPEQRQPTIYAADVRAAAQVLGLKHDWREFWATAPGRHGWDVYTKDEKVQPGVGQEKSKGEKKGKRSVHVRPEVAEALLRGLDPRSVQMPNDVLETVEDGSDEFLERFEDEDAWTLDEASDSGSDSDAVSKPERKATPGSETDTNPEHEDDDEEDEEETPDTHSKRRRAHRRTDPTPHELSTQQRAETAHLSHLDSLASQAEESRLWTLLNLSPPTPTSPTVTEGEDEENNTRASQLEPGKTRKRRLPREELRDWREGMEYVAAWEVGLGRVPAEEFVAVQRRGERGKKRRLNYAAEGIEGRGTDGRGGHSGAVQAGEGEGDDVESDEDDADDGNGEDEEDGEEQDGGEDDEDEEEVEEMLEADRSVKGDPLVALDGTGNQEGSEKPTEEDDASSSDEARDDNVEDGTDTD